MSDTPTKTADILYTRVKDQMRATELSNRFQIRGFRARALMTPPAGRGGDSISAVFVEGDIRFTMTASEAERYLRRMETSITVEFRALENLGDLPTPAYETDGAAGMDIRAAIAEPMTVYTHQVVVVPCGFSVAIPEGYEIQVRPRSGLAAKKGVTVLNSPGTIDSDYRGEVMAIIINHGREPFIIERGDRIAQMVLAPVSRANLVLVPELSLTTRGEGRFGSTGK